MFSIPYRSCINKLFKFLKALFEFNKFCFIWFRFDLLLIMEKITRIYRDIILPKESLKNNLLNIYQYHSSNSLIILWGSAKVDNSFWAAKPIEPEIPTQNKFESDFDGFPKANLIKGFI